MGRIKQTYQNRHRGKKRYVTSALQASPSEVQRDWMRIIQQIGTPANLPKTRGSPREISSYYLTG